MKTLLLLLFPILCNAQTILTSDTGGWHLVNKATLTGATGATGVVGGTGSGGSVGPTGVSGASATAYTKIAGNAPTTFTPIVYAATRLTNSSGVILDTITVDGAATGTALFTHVRTIQLSGKYGGTIVTIPMQGYTLSGNLKVLTINVGTGTVLAILGATVLSAAAGVEVSIMVIGD